MSAQRVVPLSRLLVSGRAQHDVVAFARGREETLADLTGRVEALARQLRHLVARRRGARFMLVASDSYDFAVGFLAIARSGGVAVLPPNRQPGSIERLTADVNGVVGDLPVSEARGLSVLDPREIDPLPFGSIPADATLDPAATVAELFTSGSTGEAKPIEKTLAHLESEVLALEASLGPLLGAEPSTRVFATVSPQHLFGLLFRVLWPLSAGRPFAAETPLHPEELLPRLAEAPSSLLVATPVHLRRMIHRPELGRLAGSLRAVFSSGGLLDRATALGVADALGEAPIEIFGSTETGGVATRRQRTAEPESRYEPLPAVRVLAAPDGRIRVQSPYVSDGGAAEGFVMGDRAQIGTDGSFRLLGRADRVVKVGEKRLSLPEMESALLSHAWIDEAALLPLEHGNETRIGAVISLDESARSAAERDRRAVITALTEHLAPEWDRVLLPRAWRIVPSLPRDAQGKVPQRALRTLFDAPPRPRLPEFVPIERGPTHFVVAATVPDDLAALEGHFPGRPVVPGVAQLEMVRAAAREWLGRAPHISTVDALKFRTPLLPGDAFTLRLDAPPDSATMRFELTRSQPDGTPARGPEILTSGRLGLAPPPADGDAP